MSESTFTAINEDSSHLLELPPGNPPSESEGDLCNCRGEVLMKANSLTN